MEIALNLPKRKSIRLKDYDYSHAGYYFITICVHNKRSMFGKVVNGIMELNGNGKIAENNIAEIPVHIKDTMIDKFVVMPNHIHMILIVLPNDTGTPNLASPQMKSKQIVPKAIQQFKASVSRQTNIIGLWQSKYYDHIIRNDAEYREIWEYIDTNPLKWQEDKYYNT